MDNVSLVSSKRSTQTETTLAAARQPAAGDSVRHKDKDVTTRINTLAKAVALGVLVALVGIGAFGRFYTARFNGLIVESTRAMEIGDIGQQLRFGNGLATKVIRPLATAYSQPNQAGVMPELLHAPLYPYLLSMLFRARGAGDASVAVFNGLMYLFTGWVLYAITRRLWDKLVAVVVVVIYFLSVEALGFALSANGTSLGALLLAVAVWAAIRNRQAGELKGGPDQAAAREPSLLWSAIVGGVFGLAYLSGVVSFLLFIPMAVLAAAGARGRWRHWGMVAVGTVVVLAPWCVRNLVVSGTALPALAKYNLLVDTQSYPGDSIFQQMPDKAPAPIQFALDHPREILAKMAHTLNRLYNVAPRMLSTYIFPFFILGAFQFGRQGSKRSLWRLVVAAAILQTASICLYSLGVDTIGIVMPIALCLAVGSLFEAVRRTEASRLVRAAAVAIICALVLYPTVSSAVLGRKMPRNASRASLEPLRDDFEEDAVIATDSPAAVAWHAYKQAVWLPETPEDLVQLQQKGIRVDYVYLSQTATGTLSATSRGAWQQLLLSKDAPEKLGAQKAWRMPRDEMLFELHNKRK